MSQQRHAFLIGANGPQLLMPLKYAEKDAERLSTVLRDGPCAFARVQCSVGHDRNATLNDLRNFARQCEYGDLFVLHFSGHGYVDDGCLYLILQHTDLDALDTTAIDIQSIKNIMRKCAASYKVLILDCCYSGRAITGIFKGGGIIS